MKRRHSANTDDLRNSLTYFSTFLDTSNRTRDYHYTSRQSCRHFPLAHTSPINPVAASTPTRVSLLPRWCPSAKRRLNNQPSWTVQLSYPFTIILQLLQRLIRLIRISSPLPLPKKKFTDSTDDYDILRFPLSPASHSDHRAGRKGRLMRRPRTVINER